MTLPIPGHVSLIRFLKPVVLTNLLPLLAGVLAMSVIGLMLRSGQAGPLDQPNHRSLHSVAVPRSGGLGILLGLVPTAYWVLPSAAIGIGTMVLALVSWWDDRHSLPVTLRFAIHFLVSAAVVAATVVSPTSIGIVVMLTLVMVWMINLYNFMDGANGLAGGMAVFGFGAYAVAAIAGARPELGVFAAAIAAAAAGFLVFNFDPARIFMGDVGSIPLGFLSAALGLVGWVEGVWPFWFPLLAFSPFIVDATVTLLRRGIQGERVWQAHREHLYQRLVRSGWSHRRLALTAYPLMLGAAASACVLATLTPAIQALGLVIWCLLYAYIIYRTRLLAPLPSGVQ